MYARIWTFTLYTMHDQSTHNAMSADTKFAARNEYTKRFSMSNCFETQRVKGTIGRLFIAKNPFASRAIVRIGSVIDALCLFVAGDKSMLIILDV